MKKKFKFILIVLLIGVFIAGAGILTLVSAKTKISDSRICAGVYIDDVDISNMTKEEAQKAVNDYVDNLKNKKLSIKIDDNIISVTMGAIGYDYKENDYIDQVMQVGKTGNLIKRYKEIKDIEKQQLVYNLEFEIDNKKLTKLVKEKCTIYDIEAQNATMTRENGQFIVTDHKEGRKIVVEDTIEKIKSVINNWDKQDIEVEAVMINEVPEFTREVFELCNTVIGSYTTSYASSGSNRSQNVDNGAKLINGSLILPGETFSVYDTISPFTEDNGYTEAGSYVSGKVVDSIAGGICQVSTTLYNAVLKSELEVIERHPHSMSVSYVPLSQDAAIAESSGKDFKFKNNTDAPIYIEGYTLNKNITFSIWGHETRPNNRTIEFQSVTLETIQPGSDIITYLPEQPKSYEHVTQSAHVGYRAELYKIVYIDGVEQSKDLVNTSYYAATPRYVEKGSKEPPAPPEPPKPIEDEKPKDDEENPKDDETPKDDEENPKDDEAPKDEEEIPKEDEKGDNTSSLIVDDEQTPEEDTSSEETIPEDNADTSSEETQPEQETIANETSNEEAQVEDNTDEQLEDIQEE